MKKEKKVILESHNLIKNYRLSFLFIGMLIGILLSLVFQFFDLYDFLKIDNYISIAAILIDLIIVILIGLFYNKSFSDKREVKNFLVEELKSFHKNYKDFANGVYNDKLDANSILNWFKLSNMKLDNLNYFLSQNLNIKDKRIKDEIIKLRELITDSTSFNNSFSNLNVQLSHSVKSEIISNNRIITHVIFDTILKVNVS